MTPTRATAPGPRPPRPPTWVARDATTVTGRPSTQRPHTAIGKVVALVEALAEHDRLGALADATGLPASTTHRILGELVELGWAHLSDRTYTPGARLLALGRLIETDDALARLALPAVRHLCDRTGYTIHFAVLHGDVAVYALKIEGRRAYLMRSRVGDSLALHGSAIGKAVLSRMDEKEVRAIASHTGLPAVTPATITDVDALLDHLRAVRTRGWAMDDGEHENHTRCVGAPVLDARGRPFGGVSLSALDLDLSMDDARTMAKRVVETAREVSQALQR